MRKVAGEDIVEAFVMETEKLLAEVRSCKGNSRAGVRQVTLLASSDLPGPPCNFRGGPFIY
jgi:hypothetical protein